MTHINCEPQTTVHINSQDFIQTLIVKIVQVVGNLNRTVS